MSPGITLFAIAIEFILLIVSAERFIFGATAIAKRLRWPEFITGVILLAFGTSLPEITVAALAMAHHHVTIAFGSAVGSNTANKLLVLGVAALIQPLFLSGLARKQILIQCVILCAASLLVGAWVFTQGYISYVLGLCMTLGFVGYLLLLWRQMLRAKRIQKQDTPQDKHVTTIDPLATSLTNTTTIHTQLVDETDKTLLIPLWKASLYWFFGLIVLLLSSHWLIKSVLELGRATGISETILSITVIALGTSLPELAASVVSARRKQHAMVLGNVIGSNCFNILVITAIAGLFSQKAAISHALQHRDLPLMILVALVTTTMLCLPRNKLGKFNKKGGIFLGRCFGGVFVLSYIAYIIYLVG